MELKSCTKRPELWASEIENDNYQRNLAGLVFTTFVQAAQRKKGDTDQKTVETWEELFQFTTQPKAKSNGNGNKNQINLYRVPYVDGRLILPIEYSKSKKKKTVKAIIFNLSCQNYQTYITGILTIEQKNGSQDALGTLEAPGMQSMDVIGEWEHIKLG